MKADFKGRDLAEYLRDQCTLSDAVFLAKWGFAARSVLAFETLLSVMARAKAASGGKSKRP